MALLLALTSTLPACTARAEPEVIGEVYTGAGAGTLGVDGSMDTSPTAGWVEPGQRFYVTTYGSSSCPAAPTALALDGDRLRVTMTRIGGPACTADLGPTSYALALPHELQGSERVAVILELGDGASAELLLEPGD
ncbi:hypothetical protein GC722_10610 [Auraticoccus sp. F435]|uniref:Uncharacterized protein n=1 Tax=Auraticoccus cholistanensis TaxID=2656650 RepID=A0A6A9UUV8_9ACTN|nr:hypothetical protein [Auraticoccus cholistanensis]MVA76471.1 hypothetical protein [Auraticoccus cholistanensis]